MHTAIRRAGFGALIATLAFAGVACSDDDDSTETGSGSGSGTEETTTTAGEDGGEGDGDVAGFCDAFGQASEAFGSEEPPPAEEGEAILADVEATAPDELAEPVETVTAAARDALAGNEAAFDNDDFFAALSEVESYRFDNCPADEQVEVTAIDYAFEGVPSEITAGNVAFRLTNESEAEEHEMVIFARAEGETRSFEEILALPEEESETAVRFVGATGAPPGGTAVVFAELEADEYAMVCFVPVGGGEEGPPHFTQGMIHEFTVS